MPNLIQEAKNGKGRSDIYVWNHSKNLMQKAKSLHGYVHSFGEDNPIEIAIAQGESYRSLGEK